MFFVGLSGFIVTLSLAVSFPGIFILFCLGAFPQSPEQTIPQQTSNQSVWISSHANQFPSDTYHFRTHQTTQETQYKAAIKQSHVLNPTVASLITSFPLYSIPVQQRAIILYSGLRAPPIFS